jgi:hypothetical protein
MSHSRPTRRGWHMATKPLQSDSSDPETEYSQSEHGQDLEPVLVLRTAKNLVLPLRIPMPWKQQALAVPVATRSIETLPNVAFKATTQVLDRGTQRSHAITLSVGPGIDEGSVRVFLQSDSIANEENWRAHLYRGTEMRAGVPFADGSVKLHGGLPAGIYTIKLTHADAPVLPALTVALEPFSLPEALQAGQAYVARRQYIRATAVLNETADHYPENADVRDLLVLAETLATADPGAYQKEQSEFGVMRSGSDATKRLQNLLTTAKTKFGQRMASIFAARTLERTTIPDDVIAKIAQETASIVVVQVMAALKERLDARESGVKDELLLQVLDGVTERFEEVGVLRRELTDRINLLRHDAVKSADEKFGAVEMALQHFGDELAKRKLRTADYEAFYLKELGQPCWHWISRDARKIFMESEDHYRHADSRPVGDQPDFTAGLLDLCRGLEMVLNEKLGATCTEIARRVLGDTQVFIDVGKGLPEKMRNSLRPNLEAALDKSQRRKSLSPSEIAFQLYIGKLAERVLGDGTKIVLRHTPGPADVEQLAILHLITSEYRNGKTHPVPGSPHIFTSGDEMRALRKLVFGIDEEGTARKKEILDGIRRTSWLTNLETGRAMDTVSKGWGKLPGLVLVLWKALGGKAAA